MNKKKPGRIYESLAKMSYDMVKVPLALLMLQPLLLEQISGAVFFFGSTLCIAFLYAGIVFDNKLSEADQNV